MPTSRPHPPARRWLRGLTTATTTAGLVLAATPLLLAGPGQAPATAERAVTAGSAPLTDELRLVGRKKKQNRIIKRYRVRRGDTPSSIAVRYHAWTDELIKLNGATLYAGEVIRIPVVPKAQRNCTRHGHHRTDKPKQATKSQAGKPSKPKKPKADKPKKPKKPKDRRPHHVRHARGWHHADASRAEVRRVIARKARRHGVDPHLALAIAWQESGWQQRRVSSAGALGAMQIMPGTGRWISQLVGRRLNPRDLHLNAATGVRLIRILRSEARPRIAIAGYYQGLAGVRRHGMYPSTKAYVANVVALKKRIERGWRPS